MRTGLTVTANTISNFLILPEMGCTKRTFATFEIARAEASRLKKINRKAPQNEYTPLMAYRCPQCRQYHIAAQTTEEYLRAVEKARFNKREDEKEATDAEWMKRFNIKM